MYWSAIRAKKLKQKKLKTSYIAINEGVAFYTRSWLLKMLKDDGKKGKIFYLMPSQFILK